MTERARQVLDDARAAVSAHREDLFGPAFRISWFTVVGLLRSVGHVLGKVDSTHSPEMAAAIARSWSRLVESKPEPAIFWGFIDSERNRFLKNYEHGITRMRIFRSSGPAPQVLAVDLANASAKAARTGVCADAGAAIAAGPASAVAIAGKASSTRPDSSRIWRQ